MPKRTKKKTTKKQSKKTNKSDTKTKEKKIDNISNEEEVLPTSSENVEEENEKYEPPKPVKRIIKHPKADVVRSPDPDLDMNWGFAIEFTTTESLEPVWKKLKDFLTKNTHPVFGKAKWLSMDPRGYFSPRLRHFIIITGWGMQIESIPEWFSKNIAEIKHPAKVIEPSEELADENWDGYIVKDSIILTGSKFIKLPKASRKKRNLDIESKNPISSTIPRYWAQQPVFSSRDYLIPFLTSDKYNEGVTEPESFLEEYIVEQLDWIQPKKNLKFVVLPEVFKSNPNESRGINIPEEYTPEIDFSNMGGMFPGMGGMGGLDGLGNLGDLDGMDDLDDDEQITEDNDNNVIDAEIIEDKKDK